MTSGTPNVGLIWTGGTIVEWAPDRLNLAAYSDSSEEVGCAQLLRRVPEIGEVARVQEIGFLRPPSHDTTAVDWIRLAEVIQQHADAGAVDGFVVLHGTNFIEETALFLHLTAHTALPVVLVGAMRPLSGISGDADLNLLNAVRVAASESARGRGALVVMNDTIHSARDVTKASTYRVDAFRSGDVGPVGFAGADGNIAFYRGTERRHTSESEFDVKGLKRLPRVGIAVAYAGCESGPIDALVAAKAEGIVIAGAGAGYVPEAMRPGVLRAIAKGIVVCTSTRVGSGRVLKSPSWAQGGCVSGDDFQPWKARIVLSLGLTRTRTPSEIQRIFDSY